jgi:hypothetical protein
LREPESRNFEETWIPASAGMTVKSLKHHLNKELWVRGHADRLTLLQQIRMRNLLSSTCDDSRWPKMKLFSVGTLILGWLFWSEPLFSQELVAKARDEKKLVLYHSTGIDDTQQILDRFRKRYPFLQVENHRLSSPKIIQRIITEVRAGRDLADAYLISGLQTWLLKDMGYLAVYNSPERAKIRPALRDRQGYWTGVLWNLGVLGYNTNIVAAGAVPKTCKICCNRAGKDRSV